MHITINKRRVLFGVALLLFSFILVGITSKVKAEEENNEGNTEGNNTVSYCVDFITGEYEFPSVVYYSIEQSYSSGSEDEEMPIIPLNPSVEKKQAQYTSDGCYSFSFSEKELENGNVLRIEWENKGGLWSDDYHGWYLDCDIKLDYEEWCSKKEHVTKASDGNDYTVVDKFYETATSVTVGDNGYTTWESVYPNFSNYIVVVYNLETVAYKNELDNIEKDILNNKSEVSKGLGEVIYNLEAEGETEEDSEVTLKYYFEKSAGGDCKYLSVNESGKYVFDAKGAVSELGGEAGEYFVGVYSGIGVDEVTYINQSGNVYDYDTLYGADASLDGYFVQRYYINLSPAACRAKNEDRLTMEFIIDGKTIVESFNPEYKNDAIACFEYNIPMTKLNKPVSAYLCYSNKKIYIGEYTAKAYLDSILKKDEYQAYFPVIKSLINYGGYAQEYFKYEVDSLVNDGLYTYDTDPVNLISTESVSQAITANLRGTTENDDVVLVGVSLVCQTNTAVKYYFKTKNGMTSEEFIEKYNYKQINTANYLTDMEIGDAEGGLIYVRIDKQSVYHLSEIEEHLEFRAEDGSKLDIYFTPISYVKWAMDSKNEKLIKLCKALYLYNRATLEFRNNNKN